MVFFLACCIPDLEFDSFVLTVETFLLKRSSYSSFSGDIELIIDEAMDNTTFADTLDNIDEIYLNLLARLP